MNDEKKQQFNIYLWPELIRAVKHAAIERGVSISSLVEAALQAHLTMPLGSGPAGQLQPPLGLRPTIAARDRDVTSAFYEALGLQRVAPDLVDGPVDGPVDLLLGGSMLGITSADLQEPAAAISLSFISYEPLEDVLVRLADRGILPLRLNLDDPVRTMVIRDPDGRVITIIERTTSA